MLSTEPQENKNNDDDDDDDDNDDDDDDEEDEDEAFFESGPQLGYAQQNVAGAWIELGSVIVEVDPESGVLAVSCAFSGISLVETLITSSISCIQRKNMVRWLSPDDGDGDVSGVNSTTTTVVVVETWSHRHAAEITNAVAKALGRKSVLLPLQKLPAVGSESVSLDNPVVVFSKTESAAATKKAAAAAAPCVGSLLVRGGGGGACRRSSLIKQACTLVMNVSSTASAFQQALERGRARKAVLILARGESCSIVGHSFISILATLKSNN